MALHATTRHMYPVVLSSMNYFVKIWIILSSYVLLLDYFCREVHKSELFHKMSNGISVGKFDKNVRLLSEKVTKFVQKKQDELF